MSENIVQLEIPKGNTPRARNGVPDVQIMKKAILAQISDVAEEDLNVMQYNEILSFYNELMHACVEERTVQSTNTDSGELRKDQLGTRQADKVINGEKQTQKNKHTENQSNQGLGINNQFQNPLVQNQRLQNESDNFQNQIIINGIVYCIPKTLNDNSYRLANKRFEIICNPKSENIQDKRKAVIDCYSSSMSETIKLMKDPQIQQIYTRLCFHSLKEGQLNVKNIKSYDQLRERNFSIYLKKEQLSENVIFYGQKNRKQSLRLSAKPERNENEKGDSEQKQVLLEQNEYDDVEDEFFDEFCNNQNQSIAQQPITEKIEKKPASKPQPSLRQTLKSLKQKQKTSSSVQTQKLKSRQLKPKSQITIITQTEYVQEISQYGQQQEKRPQRSRRLIQDKESQVPFPYKINSSKFQKDILNPGSTPSQEVLQWIRNMKETINKIEYEYMSQFNNNWSILSDE